MEDLFGTGYPVDGVNDVRRNLAARMRPLVLEDFAGQSELMAEGKLLRRLIESNRFSALLFYGPPGTGKTSLAGIIAQKSTDHFVKLNAVEATVSDLRKAVIEAAERWKHYKKRTLVLVDEIHRFNKAQQDALLPHVEEGTIRLIGATTQNPFFSVNSALLSRMQLFEFKSLEERDIHGLLLRILISYKLENPELMIEVSDEALHHWSMVCEGDARRALNAFEVALCSTMPEEGILKINLEVAEESIQKKAIVYDRDGDAHYDTLSAFIKSIRGNEPDAAIYLLAKMLAGGEDIRVIARRLVISAAEDIGMADPPALVLATACQQAVESIGMPEARILLAEVTVYLATAPKSNASYVALEEASQELKQNRTITIPPSLKDSSYGGAVKLGHGVGYEYPHDFVEALGPDKLFKEMKNFYRPTGRGYEKLVKERIEHWQRLRNEQQKTSRVSK